jgi:hypothetical protein
LSTTGSSDTVSTLVTRSGAPSTVAVLR